MLHSSCYNNKIKYFQAICLRLICNDKSSSYGERLILPWHSQVDLNQGTLDWRPNVMTTKTWDKNIVRLSLS